MSSQHEISKRKEIGGCVKIELVLFTSTSGQVFCRQSLNLGLCGVFLMIRVGLWDLGRKSAEVKWLSCHIRSRVHAISMIYL